MKNGTLIRRVTVFFLVFSLLLGFGSFGIVNAEQAYEVSVNNTTACTGGLVTLEVSMDPGTDFNALQLVFDFDASKLMYVEPETADMAKGDALKTFESNSGRGMMDINANSSAEGEITISYINFKPYSEGGGAFKLTFEVQNGAVGKIPVGVTVKEMVKDNSGTAVIIPTTVKPGSITVINSVPLTSIALNKQNVSLEKGSAEQLLVKYDPENTTDDKTVIWESSNNMVATVKDGVVTGVNSGTATISAKVGSYTANCVIRIEPVAPVNVKTLELTNNSIMLAWDAAQGVTSYNIYKDNMKINVEPIIATQYKVEGLNPKTQYVFSVKSVDNGLESKDSSVITVRTMGNPVNLTVGTVSGSPGRNVILRVNISENSTVGASRLAFDFDNENLEYVNTTAGNIAQDGIIVQNQDGNKVTIGYINQMSLTKNGTFLEIEFKIKEGISEQKLPVSMTILELTDELGFDLIPVVVNGEIQVYNVELGDISGDGRIKAFDALMVLQIVTGKGVATDSQKYAADIDGNGSITAYEALRILQYATGKITEF